MAGLEVFNNTNRLIISPTYKNYSIVEKGTIANSGSLPQEAVDKIILVRPSGGVGIVYGSSVGLLGITGQGSISNTTGARVKSSTGYLDYAVLQVTPPASASSHGLVVYGDDGTISFDSYYSGACPVATLITYQRQTGTSILTTNVSGLPSLLSGRYRYITTTSLFVHQYGFTTPTAAHWYGTYAKFNSLPSIEVGSLYNTGEAYLGYTISVWGINVDKNFRYYFFDA